MKFRDLLEKSNYKDLEKELNKLSTSNASFGVLNDVKGVFTLTYKTDKNGEKDAKKLANDGFKILKKFYPNAKEVKADFKPFPYEKDTYNYEVQYNLGK